MHKQLRKIRLIIKGVINSFLFKLMHSEGFDSKQAILIFGSIRSGSTWLAEVLSSIEGHVQVFEPLHPGHVPVIKRVFNYPNPYIPVTESWPEGHSLIKRILSGKLINSWVMSQASIRDVLKAKRLVIKFVRGNLLLEWVAVNMKVMTPILVIRHPCAIVASQLSKGWNSGIKRQLNHPYLDRYPEIRERCADLSEPEEVAALTWCIRYHAPLMAQHPYPFLLVSYEKLVRDGRQELERIFKALDIPLGREAISHLYKPSDTVVENSQIVMGRDPLAGWKEKLSQVQIDNILAVLKIFDLDFYSEKLEPDYEKMMSYGTRFSNGR